MYIRTLPGRDEFVRLAAGFNVVPVCKELLADTQTPVSLLKKFSDRKDVFLLESVVGGENWGRYSFLGVSARNRVLVYSDRVEILNCKTKQVIVHNGDPFAVLREFSKQYREATPLDMPRFAGGLVGVFNYETVGFIEDIAVKVDKAKPVASFVVPDEIIVFDNVRHSVSCIVLAFTDDHGDVDQCYDRVMTRLSALADSVESNTEENNTAIGSDFYDDFSCNCSEDEFRDMVKTVKGHIYEGDIIQAVISQQFSSKAPEDPVSLYRALRYINPSPYLYYMAIDDRIIIGASPETMVRLDNRTACVRPIAGTRKRGGSEQEDRALADELLKDQKERAEHLMLVDLGRNDLGRVGKTGTVQVTDLMVVERYSHVMHLVSNVTCQIDDKMDAFDLFKATFPAGTLSGAPKVRAMEIIAALEKSPRGCYGGAVGYIAFNGNMDMAITIRTAVIEDGRITIQAGAGIVADSDPESERVETVNKAMAVRRAIEFVKKSIMQEKK
ncbi:MAG: chorismate-binding protein [Sedimentisphaerales bacterium]|nr:chorismate-binding protein [Sedimentisphaerales bacterium]MBN2842906.1 chorismate-binding protein [Sedimentisphaerales bacterium]